METLVATVLIVIVFMVASMLLNSLFVEGISQRDDAIRQELLLLQYRYGHGKLEVPYYGEVGPWNVQVTHEEWQSDKRTLFMAVHKENNREISFEIRNE